MPSAKPTYIDLFAGCGGLSLGLHLAGWQGLFAIEKSPDAFETLEFNLIQEKKHFNWPSWLPQGAHDIKEVLKEYKEQLEGLRGKVDMVVGGPPCQGFSSAGKRRESDERNKLVQSYIQFISYVKPKVIFFENVKGFTLEFKKNRSKGKAYSEYVVNALKRQGYRVKGELVNFAEYGVPQKRTRFILVGIHKDIAGLDNEIAGRFFQILKENCHQFLQEKGVSSKTTLEEAISDLLKSNGVYTDREMKRFMSGNYSEPKSAYQKLMRSYIDNDHPDSHRFTNHSEKIVSRFQLILKQAPRNKDISSNLKAELKIKKHTTIPLDPKDSSPTITTLPDDYIHYLEPRILTVREYARIQSFPDWYKIRGKYTTGGKVRTKEVPRYSQIGNAIPPLFGEQCGIAIKNLILNGRQD